MNLHHFCTTAHPKWAQETINRLLTCDDTPPAGLEPATFRLTDGFA
jgi:hypothetical protein